MKRIHFLNACYWWTICPIIMRLIFNDLVIFNQNSILPSTINSKFALVFFNSHISKIQPITHNNGNIKWTEFNESFEILQFIPVVLDSNI